jgi:hypothetical protein
MQMEGCNPLFDPNGDWRRQLTFAEEDRRRLTAAPWTGGFRWFRTPNVVDLECYRRQRQMTCDAEDSHGDEGGSKPGERRAVARKARSTLRPERGPPLPPAPDD